MRRSMILSSGMHMQRTQSSSWVGEEQLLHATGVQEMVLGGVAWPLMLLVNDGHQL